MYTYISRIHIRPLRCPSLTGTWLSCPFCQPVRSYFTWCLIADRVLTLPGKMLKSDQVMASKVLFLLGFSIRLDNVNTLCFTSCFLVPILSNFVLILVWPASHCTTQGHSQSETNERCDICQQKASHQLEIQSSKSKFNTLTSNLNKNNL